MGALSVYTVTVGGAAGPVVGPSSALPYFSAQS